MMKSANAFIQASTKDIYDRCGKEFGDDFLHLIGSKLSRYDRDVWMRLRDIKCGYDYICTHVDNFKIMTKEPAYWVDKISTILL